MSPLLNVLEPPTDASEYGAINVESIQHVEVPISKEPSDFVRAQQEVVATIVKDRVGGSHASYEMEINQALQNSLKDLNGNLQKENDVYALVDVVGGRTLTHEDVIIAETENPHEGSNIPPQVELRPRTVASIPVIRKTTKANEALQASKIGIAKAAGPSKPTNGTTKFVSMKKVDQGKKK